MAFVWVNLEVRGVEMLMLHLPGAASHRRLYRRQIKLRAAAPVLGELLFDNPLITSFRLVAKLVGSRSSLFVVLPTKGVLPTGHGADVEVFQFQGGVLLLHHTKWPCP
jgi:hypothetical protein